MLNDKRGETITTTYPFTTQYMTLMDTNIYCTYAIDEKPPIILIHGFVASSYTFQPIMSHLALHFSVIAIDLPGYGRSEKPKTFTYSYANYATLIKSCMDHFKLDKVFLAGHSMGGQIALYTARMIPEQIEKMVLINSSACWWRVPTWARILSRLPFSYMAIRHIVQKESI
ncbi:MAG TPA: alpha/beta hydrolase, partial [Bacillota bacterium]|nr:alpha/beta hydrolase [Bacillota bacterium]